MKKIIFAIILFSFCTIEAVYSQKPVLKYGDYDWEKKPKLTAVQTDTSNHSVVIFDKTINEYAYEDKLLWDYKTVHRRVKVITNVGVENYNKVYIPVSEDAKIIAEKARVIKNDGSVRELSKDEIKEGFDEESGQKYHYFAFEGVETGCEIEYLYSIQEPSLLYGSIFTIQFANPVLHAECIFVAPQNLYLKFKSFNGCPEVKRDTNETEVNKWVLVKDSIPRLKDEESANYDANKMKFAMKLNYNSATGKKDIYSYGQISSDVYENIYTFKDPKEDKAVKNILKEIKVDKSNEEAEVRSVENYLKSTYIYTKSEDKNKEIPSKIFANKVYNDFGAVRVFANIFKDLGIEHEIVLTCDRFSLKFARDFESYSFVNDYLIYFPGIKKFLSPADNFTRLGFPEDKDINNYGLFIKGVSMGEFSTGIGKIKFIDGAKYNESLNKLYIKANISPDFQDMKYKVRNELTGYEAAVYQPYFAFIQDKDKLKDFRESLIKYIDKEGTIDSLEYQSDDGKYFGQKPLIATAVLKSDYFFEKAGNKYLFKVGMLIGPQIEMYKKEERKMPVEFPYSRMYDRTIEFNIPDGYKVPNLDLINMSETYIRNSNDTTMAFISKYKLDGNKVTIHIVEYYKEYEYTIKEFEEYRRVGNASANFNKVVLVFEKK